MQSQLARTICAMEAPSRARRHVHAYARLRFKGHFGLVSCPDPLARARKRVWCSERLFLLHGAG